MCTDRTKHIRHIGVVAPQAVLPGSRFLRAPLQISKRAAGEATEFSRNGVELLGVISAARLECGEPPAETGELIRRQLGNSFGVSSTFISRSIASRGLVEATEKDWTSAGGDAWPALGRWSNGSHELPLSQLTGRHAPQPSADTLSLY